MWKDYTKGYLKNNRASAVSVMSASFVSALLLSFLSALFYNLWKYEVERLTAEGDTDALQAMYLTRAAGDTAPRLVFPLFLLIMGLAAFSLVIIIHNVFAVSIHARVHQFGIFSSIGATPHQIRVCLFQEAALWCALPIGAGTLFGIAGTKGILNWVNLYTEGMENRRDAVFGYHPLILLLTILITGVTIGISVWLPAAKLSRMTPLDAIRNAEEEKSVRRKSSRVLSFWFGVEGELAGNALRAQRKALRTASLSLLFSILAFTLMQCFFTLSAISTRETYFERYQDAWDIMVTVKDIGIGDFTDAERIRALPEARDVAVYQKAAAKCRLFQDELSEEMRANGGFLHASEKDVEQIGETYIVHAPIVILDDESFLRYCEQVGAAPRLDGAVVFNRIRDVTNPDFRHPQYMPYLKESGATVLLGSAGTNAVTVELPVLTYTQEAPCLREAYATTDFYELVHFVPQRLWEERMGQLAGTEESDTYVRILAEGTASLAALDDLQREIDLITAGYDRTESENRMREYEENDREIRGMMTVFGSFCVLLALIGASNLFSVTLGFVRQRKREIVRYLSVGMTPGELGRMFAVEALVIVGRPVLLVLPVAALAVGAMMRASYMDPAEFFAEAPFLPIIVFILALWAAVACAYRLGWRQIKKIDLTEVLRNDAQ
ncbi:MAG: ABC transporter permease [Bacteroidales bacterium]|nr:ABC transporter permease [Bacteroidales bacterium]